jgi:CHAT domain-containing protein
MGASLFRDLMPDELKNVLWTLRDSITSVQVQSEEPWIPWELCKLVSSSPAGGVEEGPFLCEAFQLTRWIPGLSQFPRLSMKSLALVVPDDSALAFAAAERDYMLSLAGPGRQVTRIPATFLDVEAALALGAYDAWHFSGHGIFRNEALPDRSALILQGGDRLTPEDLSGQAANLGRPHPLVFLNACQVGQSGMSLTGMGGWAIRFLNAGAGGFLGAYWSVYDEPALNFAKAFFARLIAGDPVGKAAHEARLGIRATGDPTWLAYTVFADPLATLAQ